ncbi:MAG: hypothetical protein AB2L14_17905 [Candidatus Xenobiia bacterium LiM19]
MGWDLGVGDWVSEKASKAGNWASEKASQAGSFVSDKAGEAKKALVNGASELYQSAGSTLTNVKDYVSEKAGQAGDYVSEKAGQAGNYVSEKATQAANWAKSDDSNVMGTLKYANPMYYTGKATEYAGKGVKWAGEKINDGAGAIDKAVNSTDSRLVNNPIVGRTLGTISGTLGFAGGLVEGVGSLVDYGGRIQQGDKKTIDSTISTGKSIGEGAAYIQGKYHEGMGTLVEKTGDLLGSDTIKTVGKGVQGLGQTEQSLASDKTKRVLDNVGEAGIHYAGHLAEKEGQAFKWVGDTVGSDTVSKVGNQIGQGADIMKKTTENNALVSAIDKAVDEKAKEYREHGDYAVSRDSTRAVLEVASLVVAPEALIGKVGTGANVAGKVGKGVEALDKAADVAKVVDKAADVAKTADKAADAAKVVDKAADVAKTADKAADVAKTADKAADVAKTADKAADVAKTADKAADVAKTADKAADVAKTADKAADAAKTADNAADAAKTADKATDTVKASDTAADTTKAADKVTVNGVEYTKQADGTLSRTVQSTDSGPAWTEKVENGVTTKTRQVPDNAGGPAWTEKVENGVTTKTRQVPDNAGGPAWTESDTPLGISKKRTVPATDGGPAWTEHVGLNGDSWSNRTINAADGGHNWSEIKNVNGQFMSREVPATDGKGIWTEWILKDKNGAATRQYQTRSYMENGKNWVESIEGQNRWRIREGGAGPLQQESRIQGVTSIHFTGPSGPQAINVYGGATQKEIDMVYKMLDKLPPEVRANAREIYLSDNLGEVMNLAGQRTSGIGGLAGNGRILVERGELATERGTAHVLYHEMGHIADDGGKLSNKGPWGKGFFVSDYAKGNALEDFAEVHRVVLTDMDRYSSMSRWKWIMEPGAEKKMEILRMYGVQAPDFGPAERLIRRLLGPAE